MKKLVFLLPMLASINGCAAPSAPLAEDVANVKMIKACSSFALDAYRRYDDNPMLVYGFCMDNAPK